MKKEDIKVSVIIPVYNSEKYLEKCLNSVIGQTMKEIEIICINDCSTDNSSNILFKYAQNDERIRVYENKINSGMSITRNVGVDMAQGEYIQFLDSDDYLAEDTLETYYSVARENDLDVLQSGYTEEKQERFRCVPETSVAFAGQIFEGRQMFSKLEYEKVYYRVVWCFLLKREFVISTNLKLYENIYHEDLLYVFDVYARAKRCMFMNAHKYVYVKRPNSITTMQRNEKHIYGHIVSMYEIIRQLFPGEIDMEYRIAVLNYLRRIYDDNSHMVRAMRDKGTLRSIEALPFHNIGQEYLSKFVLTRTEKNLINIDLLNANIERIRNANTRIIYGAGNGASLFLQWAEKVFPEGIEIAGIAVSERQEKQSFFGHKVREIIEFTDEKEALIIVAITKNNLGNLKQQMEKYGFTNILYACN